MRFFRGLEVLFCYRHAVAVLLVGCLAPAAPTGIAHADEVAAAGDQPAFSADDLEFFESKIRPLFVARCQECHGDEKQEGSLRIVSLQRRNRLRVFPALQLHARTF